MCHSCAVMRRPFSRPRHSIIVLLLGALFALQPQPDGGPGLGDGGHDAALVRHGRHVRAGRLRPMRRSCRWHARRSLPVRLYGSGGDRFIAAAGGRGRRGDRRRVARRAYAFESGVRARPATSPLARHRLMAAAAASGRVIPRANSFRDFRDRRWRRSVARLRQSSAFGHATKNEAVPMVKHPIGGLSRRTFLHAGAGVALGATTPAGWSAVDTGKPFSFRLRPAPARVNLVGRAPTRPRTCGPTTARCPDRSCGCARASRSASSSRTSSARRHHGPLARHPAAERDGRRARPDPAADQAGRKLHLRVHAARCRHLLVPPARRQPAAARARPRRRADRRGARSRALPVDRDLLWMLADWRLTRTGRSPAASATRMEAAMSGRVGNTVTINGRVSDERAGARRRAHPAAARQCRARPHHGAALRGPSADDRGDRRPALRAARAGRRPRAARPRDARRSCCSTCKASPAGATAWSTTSTRTSPIA